MGTNYYLHTDVCPHCNRPDKILHIGKSSGGWCFSLHVIVPDKWDDEDTTSIRSLADWQTRWDKPDAKIVDEDGEHIEASEMMSVITAREHPEAWESLPNGYVSWLDFHRRNCSQRGPNGLLRHVIGGSCVANGDGTYDLIDSEFS